MLDPLVALEMTQARQRDLIKAAETERLIKRASAGRTTLPDLVLLRAGDVLVRSGLRAYTWYRLRRFRRWARVRVGG